MPAEDLLNGQVWGRAPAVQSAPPPRQRASSTDPLTAL
jgi:hypothetical protein